MAKNARYIVLIAGIFGCLGLFQPLFSIGRWKLRTDFSAYELSFKSGNARKLVETRLPLLVELKLPEEVRETRDDVRMIVEGAKNAAYAFIPSVLLLLLGIAGVKRKRLGRPLAALAVLAGIASVAAYIGLKYGIIYGEQEEPILQRMNLQLEIGAKVLLAGGAAAVIFAAVALIKGEPSADLEPKSKPA
jgi:hypothetical protein